MADIDRLFPDVQGLLVEAIAVFPGVHDAGTETPADLDAALPFVRVTGGSGPTNALNTRPVLDIDVFGVGYEATKTLARRLQVWLLGPPPPIWQLDHVTSENGPQELPWAEDGGPRRFGLTFRFTARRRAEP